MAALLAPDCFSVSKPVSHTQRIIGAAIYGHPDGRMSGVLKRSWNSDIPLRLSHVIITKTLGIHQAIDIRALILKCMGLWEEGVHSILVVDEEAEGVAREVRDAREEEEEYGQAKAFHVTVLPGKLRQAVHQENDREEGGLFLDNLCTKTGQPVKGFLQ